MTTGRKRAPSAVGGGGFAGMMGLVSGVILSLALMFAPAATQAQSMPLPVVVERGAITVRAESGLQGLARDIADLAPDYMTQIRADLADLPAPEAVEIRLVKRARDLTRAAPTGRGAPEWASGVAYPDQGVVVVATRREAESIDVPQVVAHELAHIALDKALGAHAPRWLHEGFAFLHTSEWSMARTQTLVGMAWTGDVIPLPLLDRQFAGDQVVVDRAYAQSYDFVAFLARRGRYPDALDDGDRWPFRNFLAAISAGKPLGVAAREAFSARLGQLFEEWRNDLRQRYLLMPSGLFTLGIWGFAAMLLVLGYLRRRRLNRQTLARWEREEALWEREQAHGVREQARWEHEQAARHRETGEYQ